MSCEGLSFEALQIAVGQACGFEQARKGDGAVLLGFEGSPGRVFDEAKAAAVP